MRTNVPFTLLLTFASLIPSTTALAVRTAHPAAHKAEVSSGSMTKKKAHKPSGKAAAKAAPQNTSKAASKAASKTSARNHKPKQSKKRSVSEQAAPVTMERIHGRTPMRRKATADDFVKAGKTAHVRKISVAPSGSIPVASRGAAPEQAVTISRREITRKPTLASVADEATTPAILPTLYNKRGRLIVPPALKGSHEILVRQNVVADRDGLDRIQDDADLNRMRAQRLLVGLPVSRELDVDDRLPVNRRYARPWTAQFLATLARAHYARFHTSLQVNSAVRTVEFQQHLMHINGNAAPAEGETASPHLTGQAIDIAKHGLSMTEIAWMRGYLLPLIQEGRIDVEEEFQQSCFHISVYRKYAPAPGAPSREIASTQHGGTSALAVALR